MKNNRPQINKRKKERYNTDPIYKLNHNMSNSIKDSLKENNISKNRRHWEDIVGYTKEQLKEHLEKLFKPDMNWNNHGEWHIDHKIPISFFKYTSMKDIEFRYCWSLDNLQPLWAIENLKKHNKIIN